MTDQVDQAQEFEAMHRDIAMRERRSSSLQYTGSCYNCGDITGGGRRFCDADCRDDYAKREKLKGIHAGSN